MILFIASEVMFFVGWFWAFFDFALFPATVDAVGGVWPPKGNEVINPFELPLLNTIILLTSGTTVTWAPHTLIHGQRGGDDTGIWGLLGLGNRHSVLKGLLLQLVFGSLLRCSPPYEYAHPPFAFTSLT